jgi:hypothetical protein
MTGLGNASCHGGCSAACELAMTYNQLSIENTASLLKNGPDMLGIVVDWSLKFVVRLKVDVVDHVLAGQNVAMFFLSVFFCRSSPSRRFLRVLIERENSLRPTSELEHHATRSLDPVGRPEAVSP